MLSDLFLQTFILSAIALAAAVLILIGVLPVLLPEAIRTVRGEAEGLRQKLQTELSKPSESVQEVLE